MRDSDPHFDIETPPPIDSAVNLGLEVDPRPESHPKDAQLVLNNFATLPSGTGFWTLQLPRRAGDGSRLLADACAPTLECVELAGKRFGASFLRRTSIVHHIWLSALTVLNLASTIRRAPKTRAPKTRNYTGWLPSCFQSCIGRAILFFDCR